MEVRTFFQVVFEAFEGERGAGDGLVEQLLAVHIDHIALEGTGVGGPAEFSGVARIELVVGYCEVFNAVDDGGEAHDLTVGDLASSVHHVHLDEVEAVVFEFRSPGAGHEFVGPVDEHIGGRILCAKEHLHLSGVSTEFPFKEHRVVETVV